MTVLLWTIQVVGWVVLVALLWKHHRACVEYLRATEEWATAARAYANKAAANADEAGEALARDSRSLPLVDDENDARGAA